MWVRGALHVYAWWDESAVCVCLCVCLCVPAPLGVGAPLCISGYLPFSQDL